jgi:beta-galactosidase GanA
MKRPVQWMLRDSGAHPDLFPAPDGVEVYRRFSGDREIFIVENDGQDEKIAELPDAMTIVLTDETVRAVRLPAYGVAVLKETQPGK